MENNNVNQSRPVGEKLWTHDFVLLLIMSFANMFCMQLITTSIAPWVSSLDLPSSYTGLFTLCFTLPCLIGCFVWARLTRKTGRRIIILTGSLLFGVCVLLMPLAAPGVALIVILRIIQGAGYSAVNNGMMATQADVITPKRLGEGLGFFGMAQSLTLVIGPGTALFIIQKGGFVPVFVMLAALCACVFVLCLFLRAKIGAKDMRQQPGEEMEEDRSQRGLWLFLEKKSIFPCLLLLLSMAALGSTNFYAATYAADLQFGNASLFFVVYALAEVAVLTVVGRLSDRLPMGMLLIPGMVVSALGLLWLSSVHSAAPFLLASIPIGVGTGMIVPVAQAAAFRGVEKHRRGMASATYYIAFDGGMCLGSLIWGFAIEGAGFRGMYRYAAALLVVTAIICAVVTALKKENKGSARPVSDGR